MLLRNALGLKLSFMCACFFYFFFSYSPDCVPSNCFIIIAQNLQRRRVSTRNTVVLCCAPNEMRKENCRLNVYCVCASHTVCAHFFGNIFQGQTYKCAFWFRFTFLQFLVFCGIKRDESGIRWMEMKLFSRYISFDGKVILLEKYYRMYFTILSRKMY